MSDNDRPPSVLPELTIIRRQLAVSRFTLFAILVIVVICLALLLILAGRAM
jgi:hypothetical protein